MADSADLETATAAAGIHTVEAAGRSREVRVREASGSVRTGQVVAADLVLVRGEALRAPAVVELADGSQVTAIRIVGPVLDDAGEISALEFVPGTGPSAGAEGAAASKPFWCGIFGNRLASCR